MSVDYASVREAWIERSRSTGRASLDDVVALRDVARELYAARKWPCPPDSRVVVAPSPFAALVAAGAAAAYWALRGTQRKMPKRPDVEALAAMMGERRGQALSSMLRGDAGHLSAAGKVHCYVYSPVLESCRCLRHLVEVPTNMATDLLGDAIDSGGTLGEILRSAIEDDGLFEHVAAAVRACAGDEALEFEPAHLVGQVGQRAAVALVGDALCAFDGGNLRPAFAAAATCARLLGYDLGREVALGCRVSERFGPWLVHPQFCVASDRPVELHVASGGGVDFLHSDDGPACRWADGTRLYCLRGVSVGERSHVDPSSLTADRLQSLKPAQRGVCFDRAPKGEQVLLAVREMSDADDS